MAYGGGMSKPIVHKPKMRGEKRVGRGFSLGELREAGISIGEAKELGIYIDNRRKSVHRWNVETLKKLKVDRPRS